MTLLLPRTLALETARIQSASPEKLDITGARALRTVSCAKQQRELQIFEMRTV